MSFVIALTVDVQLEKRENHPLLSVLSIDLVAKTVISGRLEKVIDIDCRINEVELEA